MPHAIPGALTLGLDILRNEHELGTRMFFLSLLFGKRDGAAKGYVSVLTVAILGLQGGLQLSISMCLPFPVPFPCHANNQSIP
jgi:hypothetical protein